VGANRYGHEPAARHKKKREPKNDRPQKKRREDGVAGHTAKLRQSQKKLGIGGGVALGKRGNGGKNVLSGWGGGKKERWGPAKAKNYDREGPGQKLFWGLY